MSLKVTLSCEGGAKQHGEYEKEESNFGWGIPETGSAPRMGVLMPSSQGRVILFLTYIRWTKVFKL